MARKHAETLQVLETQKMIRKPQRCLSRRLARVILTLPALLACVLGCVPRSEKEVVVYCALDREFSKPILDGFRRQQPETTVNTVFDVEASKTVGLVSRIEAEKDRPRCDLFWNNEILHTLRLQKAGLLHKRTWQVPANWPTQFRAADGSWVAVAARARVLLVNTKLLPDPAQWPKSVLDVAGETWKGKAGIAFPLFGTTATHFAVLDTKLGTDKAVDWFKQVAANAVVLSGNKQVAQAVASGQLSFGLTDTDDAIIERERGAPVAIVFPDQQAEQLGTLLLPTTVAVLEGGPHPQAAELLADYLVSEDIESRLAMADSAQIPIRPGAKLRSRVEPKEAVRWMEVDYGQAAERWESLQGRLREIFSEPK